VLIGANSGGRSLQHERQQAIFRNSFAIRSFARSYGSGSVSSTMFPETRMLSQSNVSSCSQRDLPSKKNGAKHVHLPRVIAFASASPAFVSTPPVSICSSPAINSEETPLDFAHLKISDNNDVIVVFCELVNGLHGSLIYLW